MEMRDIHKEKLILTAAKWMRGNKTLFPLSFYEEKLKKLGRGQLNRIIRYCIIRSLQS